MEALCVQPWEKDGMIVEGERVREGRGLEVIGMEAPSPTGSATEEDTDEEPEPPPVPRRKVSFADAFGLDLVSVKEFDNAEASESYENPPLGREVSLPQEEVSVSCLFTLPSSPEELDQRLGEQMVELESIELLPGTTTIRGNIRVANLCYTKSVHVRMSLDRWESHFELPADYVPGSSDMKTDRFTFTYMLVPPLEMEGSRVELCLRYETPLGTFWANNKGLNYVLFCNKRVPVNGSQAQEEGKSKRSCLRANRRPSAEGKPTEPGYTPAGFAEAAEKAKNDREAAKRAELRSLSYQKSLVESVKSRRRGTRLARVQDFMSQQRQRSPKACPQDVDRPLLSMWGDPSGLLDKGQKSPRVLTYHEIPLLTLDWSSAMWGSTAVDDLWTGRPKSADHRGRAPSPDTRGNFPDKNADTKASVCDAWQAFLNGSTCGQHSGVLESEWLQTATSVSPSDSHKSLTGRVGAPDSQFCQMPGVALKWQPEGARVSSPGEDRSETESQADTWQGYGLKGGKHVPKGPADRSDESHRIPHEREQGGRIEGMGKDSCTALTADSGPSSGGSESTEMPVRPDSETARITNGISGNHESLFVSPVESSSNEINKADSLTESITVSLLQSEGSGNGNAASDDSAPLNDAGMEMPNVTNEGTKTLMGEGLEIIQPSDGEQQHVEEEEEEEQEVNSARYKRQMVESGGWQEDPRDDSETIRPLTNEEPNPNPTDVEETRWLLPQEDMESQEEDLSTKTSPKEMIDPLRHPGAPGRMDEDLDLKASVAELTIEEQGELRGNAGILRGDEEGGELSAEAENSSGAEQEGTKDTVDLHVMESELKKAMIEKFGEDLVHAIWKEVFKTPKIEFSVDGEAKQVVLLQREFLRPGLQCPEGLLQRLSSTGQIYPPTGLHGSDTKPQVYQDLTLSAAHVRQPPSQTSKTEDEGHPHLREEQEVAHKVGLSLMDLPWWNILYILSHIAKVSVFSGLVVGLFFYFFLCDFPAFFAVYAFSLCCWFYKWKRRQVAKAEGMEEWPGPCVKTGELL